VSHRRLPGRDYKSVRRGGLNLTRLRDLGLGLAAGLLVALIVYVGDRRASLGAVEPVPTPQHTAPRTAHNADVNGTAGADAARDGVEGANGGYDFYEGLPKFEVVVPEKEHGAHVDAAARIERPGTYFLQAGSYRNEADAERVQAQLSRQNISANVQRVQLDADVWYRIRIGPIKDLAQLNRVRQQLQAAEIVSLVIRVEE
jgi:sporulation related protein